MTEVSWPWESWEARYAWGWAALEATINYYSTMLEDWDV